VLFVARGRSSLAALAVFYTDSNSDKFVMSGIHSRLAGFIFLSISGGTQLFDNLCISKGFI